MFVIGPRCCAIVSRGKSILKIIQQSFSYMPRDTIARQRGETIELPQTGIVCQSDIESIAQAIQEVNEKGNNYFVSNIKKEKKNLSWEEFAQTLIEFVKG